MINRTMTPALEQELKRKISELETEDKYVTELFAGMKAGRTSHVTEEGGNPDAKRFGTGVPNYLGSIDTFITNPSNVGIGVIARMIETDPTVLSAVSFKSLMMLAKMGEFQHDDVTITEFVRDFLAKMYGPTFKEALEAMSSKFGYGFSVTEIIWGINKQKRKVPIKLSTYHPTTICFEVDQYGELTEWGIVQFVIQSGQTANPNNFLPSFQGGWRVKNPFETPEDRLLPYRMPFVNNYGLARIPKAKCILHVHNNMLNFGSPYGKTPVRTAHLAWQLKVFFMKQMGIAGKRQASPFVWATAPHNQNKVKVDTPQGSKDMTPVEALSSILASRETDDSIVTGPSTSGYNIEAIAQQMDLNQFLVVLNWLDTQIFRAFLLPSLVMTDGSAGSRALGDKHFEIVDRIAEEEANLFGAAIIEQMIRKAIVENFGEQKDYGKFAQRPQNLEERKGLAEMFTTLANGRWLSPDNEKDGRHVRSTLHLPEQDKAYYSERSPNLPDLGGDDEEDRDADEGGSLEGASEKEAGSEDKKTD